MNIIVREIELADRKALWEWRKDSAFKWVLEDLTWTYEDHCKWFNDLLAMEGSLMVIGVYKILRIGVVRFEKTEDDLFEMTIMMKPSYSASRLIYDFFSGSIHYLRHKQPNARIRIRLKNNTRPLRTLLRECGFTLHEAESGGLLADK